MCEVLVLDRGLGKTTQLIERVINYLAEHDGQDVLIIAGSNNVRHLESVTTHLGLVGVKVVGTSNSNLLRGYRQAIFVDDYDRIHDLDMLWYLRSSPELVMMKTITEEIYA